MKEGKYLAIDFGAGSGRAIIGVLSGNKIKLEEVHRFPNPIIKSFDSLQWDFLYLFNELKNGIKEAISMGHGDFDSVGVDTWGVDFGLISKEGQLLGSPFVYRDSRTNGMIERAEESISKYEIYSKTGIQFMQINTLFQVLSMVKNNNQLLKCADQLLFMPDLFNYFLTGVKKTEYSIASTSQLLNAEKKVWDDNIFTALNLPKCLMSPIIMPGNVIGKLLPSITRTFGLHDIDVVAVGSHDTASAVAAIPNLTKNSAYISSGTWSLIGIELDYPLISKESYENSFTNEGGIGGKIRFLSNVMGMWIIQQLKKEWENNGEQLSFDVINKLAEDAKPFKFVIDTDDEGFLNPPSMIEAIHSFCARTNQKLPSSKGEYIRSVLESLAFKYRTIIDKIEVLAKNELNSIHIVGGGSQNMLLNQFSANANNRKVICGPVEATAYGNIMVQAMAMNKISSVTEGREIIGNSIILREFEPKEINLWESEYRKSLKILEKN